MPDAHGTIVGAAASARAMVEGRRESASEAARYARSLIEVSLNPLVSINPRGKISDVNAATEEATGIPRDQLIGTDFADCFSEPEKARAAYQRVLAEGLLSDHPLVLRHFSGALTDVEYNAAVYRDESGELQAVFAAARDATEAQQSRLQVARLALIAASSQDAAFSRDLDGVITSWNAAAEALYGYTAEEAIGRNGAILMPTG
ncbi:MAG TPA: PAS domain-containing protein, partial [Candidatus Limnocylindrales bacterium]